jgi:spore coat polysaccharide biosynthesis predicted glycosyltransferase SpsG
MKVHFICKASVKDGLGHLIRSTQLAESFQLLGATVFLTVIGDQTPKKILKGHDLPYRVIQNENDLISKKYDAVFFDMLRISAKVFETLKNSSRITVSISPIFDRMDQVDLLFTRSKYHNISSGDIEIFADLKYSIISRHCERIPKQTFRKNLNETSLPIAVIMGGTDAPNKTLRVLNELKHCRVPSTFWVMLGEGYSHSFDKLIEAIRKDTDHEIILAKTNRSMWKILSNCVLAIIPGGLTSYEAAYAGLPTLNITHDPEKEFLIRELMEHKICLTHQNFQNLNKTIEDLYRQKNKILQMHDRSKSLIDKKGGERIFSITTNKLK